MKSKSVTPFKSAPAQNALPSPVMMPTRSDGSVSSHDQIASSSRWPALLMQLRLLGLLRVTSRVCGPGKEIRVEVVAGGGVWKGGGGIMRRDAERYGGGKT